MTITRGDLTSAGPLQKQKGRRFLSGAPRPARPLTDPKSWTTSLGRLRSRAGVRRSTAGCRRAACSARIRRRAKLGFAERNRLVHGRPNAGKRTMDDPIAIAGHHDALFRDDEAIPFAAAPFAGGVRWSPRLIQLSWAKVSGMTKARPAKTSANRARLPNIGLRPFRFRCPCPAADQVMHPEDK